MQVRAAVGIVVAALVLSFVLGTASCSDDGDDDGPALVAAFSAAPEYETTGPTSCPLRDIAFTDESTGDPEAWEWEFSDGSTSTEQNPVVSEAVHEATLTVTRDGQSDSTTETIPIVQC